MRRDEADIAEAFVRHTPGLLDALPVNWHWRSLVRAWHDGRMPDWPDPQRLAIDGYVRHPRPGASRPDRDAAIRRVDDPLPIDVPLRHTRSGDAHALRLLAAWTEAVWRTGAGR